MNEPFTPPDASSWNLTESETSTGEHRLSIVVPFPPNYPNTAFRRRTDAIADLLLSYDGQRNTVFLHQFYVHTYHSDIATLAEKRACKGLGKRMLCHAVAWLVARGSITPDASFSLEASGGRCDDAMVRRVMETHTEAEVDDFLAAFPLHVDELEQAYPNANAPYREKAALKCMYDENQQLIAHYQTYGLRVMPIAIDDHDVAYEPMGGLVRNVMQACDGAMATPTHGGRDRTSPHRQRVVVRRTTGPSHATRLETMHAIDHHPKQRHGRLKTERTYRHKSSIERRTS